MVQESGYHGQNRFDRPGPIVNCTCRSKNWWLFLVAMVVGAIAMVLIGVPCRILDWSRNGMGRFLQFSWRRLKRLSGLKR